MEAWIASDIFRPGGNFLLSWLQNSRYVQVEAIVAAIAAKHFFKSEI
jgi:hypothetical protein